MTQGPFVKRLIVYRISCLAFPGDGKIEDALDFLLSKGRIAKTAKQATMDIEACIAAVKAAPDNPYGDDDEKIAEEILRQLELNKKK